METPVVSESPSFYKPYLTIWDAVVFFLGAILIYILVSIFCGIIFSYYYLVIRHVSPQYLRFNIYQAMADGKVVFSLSLFGYVLIFLFMLAILYFRNQKIMDALAFKRLPDYHFRFLFALSFLLLCLTGAISYVFQISARNTIFSEVFSSGKGLLIFSIYAIVSGPLFEEVVYRGFLFNPLERRWGKTSAAIIVTILFVLSHAYVYWKTPAGLILLVPVSAAIAWLRAIRGSIIPGFIVHMIYNFVSTTIALFYYYYYRLQNPA